MRASSDPQGGDAGMVDKMIGSAFDTVRKVALELTAIKYVAAHMGAIVAVAQTMLATMPERSITVTGVTGSLGEMVELDLPPGVTVDNLRALDVLLITPDGNVYGAGSNTFTAGLVDGYLSLTTRMDAPITLVSAAIRWRVIYDSSIA